ncbi:uncharacterized protein LOC109833752 [Asparagus officinalis]|uniref:uncharacterized protein LOC109833752 n=1 Tax=Asparagus officinalis TaxID=4686 RepID=UPI00098DE1B3|nr:uncharacterized protein LOC109833752 [Asparagus officinalis]
MLDMINTIGIINKRTTKPIGVRLNGVLSDMRPQEGLKVQRLQHHKIEARLRCNIEAGKEKIVLKTDDGSKPFVRYPRTGKAKSSPDQGSKVDEAGVLPQNWLHQPAKSSFPKQMGSIAGQASTATAVALGGHGDGVVTRRGGDLTWVQTCRRRGGSGDGEAARRRRGDESKWRRGRLQGLRGRKWDRVGLGRN